MEALLLNADEDEQELRDKIGDAKDFDIQLAEHRARTLEKDLGLDLKRTGKDLFNAGGNYVTEMNLHNAGRSLQDLMSKVEISMQAAKRQEMEEMNRN